MTSPTPGNDALARVIEQNRRRGTRLANDTANAHALFELYGAGIRREADTSSWLLADGNRWFVDQSGLVFSYTERIEDYWATKSEEYREEGQANLANEAFKFARSAGDYNRKRSMLNVLATFPEILIDSDRIYETSRGFLTVKNGVVDLGTGDFAEPATRYLMHECPTEYDPTAESEMLEDFLQTFVISEDDLFNCLGAALWGGNPLRSLLILLGPTTSGKSMFIAALDKTLGNYMSIINSSIFRGQKDDKPRPDIAAGIYSRIAVAHEWGASWKMHPDQIKRITGQDKIQVRNLYQRSYAVRPHFTPIIVTNALPGIEEYDQALRKRIIVLKFRGLDGKREDISVRDRFVHDPNVHKAILRKLVAASIRMRGFPDVEDFLSPGALSEIGRFADDMMPADIFIKWALDTERIRLWKSTDILGNCAGARAIHQMYVLWNSQFGEGDPLTEVKFSRMMSDCGFEKITYGGTRKWKNFVIV